MIALDFHYRRRHLDGTTSISRTSGPAVAQRDDATAFVADYRLGGPQFATPVTGRRGAGVATLQRAYADIARLWLWPDQPLRLLQFCDAAGATLFYRVDFATRPWRRAGAAWYQTDLYLDLFVAADGREYVIMDEDELAEAVQRGMIDDAGRDQLFAALDTLVERAARGVFAGWLAETCDAPIAPGDTTAIHRWHHLDIPPSSPANWPEEDR